jgi:hypothetical protein
MNFSNDDTLGAGKLPQGTQGSQGTQMVFKISVET